MKIASKTHYAMKTLADLALHHGNGVCRISDIAQRQAIPAKFLEQILLGLKGGGLVASKRGIKGGYHLNAEPSEITVADVMKLTGGHLSPPDTGLPPERRDSSETALHDMWKELGDHMTAKLQGVTLQDVCDRIDRLAGEDGTNYVI